MTVPRNKAGVPFLIYALPRSRTAWLSNFLSYGGWACGHDRSIFMRSFDDVVAFFKQQKIGSAETAIAPGWHLIRTLLPQVRTVVIRRPVADVLESFRHLDVSSVATYDFAKLERNFSYMDRCLNRLEREPGVLSVDFADLDHAPTCAQIFEFCLPYRFDFEWWLKIRSVNIQIDAAEQLRYYFKHKDEIEAFKKHCKSLLRKVRREQMNGDDAWPLRQAQAQQK